MPAQRRRGEGLVTVLAFFILDRRVLRRGLPLGILTSRRTLGCICRAGGVVLFHGESSGVFQRRGDDRRSIEAFRQSGQPGESRNQHIRGVRSQLSRILLKRREEVVSN